MKKYELTEECKSLNNGTKLFRIRALRDFSNVKAGDLGGWIEKEENLSHEGDAWVFRDAMVFGDAVICGNAEVSGYAEVFGDAVICGKALIYGDAVICGNARVFGYSEVFGDAVICGNAMVFGDAWVSEDARVYGNAEVSGDARVYGIACVYGNSWLSGNAVISENAEVYRNNHYATIKGFGTKCRNTTFFRCKDEKIRVNCGCFFGTIDEFREQVKNTREGKIAKEYLMIADLMEYHFSDAE